MTQNTNPPQGAWAAIPPTSDEENEQDAIEAGVTDAAEAFDHLDGVWGANEMVVASVAATTAVRRYRKLTERGNP